MNLWSLYLDVRVRPLKTFAIKIGILKKYHILITKLLAQLCHNRPASSQQEALDANSFEYRPLYVYYAERNIVFVANFINKKKNKSWSNV
jgi:hypothetical protein